MSQQPGLKTTLACTYGVPALDSRGEWTKARCLTPAGPESRTWLICANKGRFGKCEGQPFFPDKFAKLAGCKVGALSRLLQGIPA